jgi:predicted enzyme related to lactoylglutathione lyase
VFLKGSIPLHLKSSAAWESRDVTGEIPAIISAKDIEQSLQFYRSLLGFDLAYRWPPEGPVEYAFLRSGEIAVWIVAEGMVEKLRRTSFSNRDVAKLELHTEVDDVAETADRIVQKGGNLAAVTIQQPDTGQIAVFEDPDGNLICIQAKPQLPGTDEKFSRTMKSQAEGRSDRK